MTARTWINGEPADCIAANDRGLQYGDGLFETMTIRQGRPVTWTRHWNRLADGCRRLGIPAPARETLESEIDTAAAGVDRAIAKLIVTRGAGGRGYRVPDEPRPTRILGLHTWPDYPRYYWTEGVRLRICRTPLGMNPALAGIKHLNRLEQVMARQEWDDPAIFEGLMCDPEGRLVEGVMTNVFFWESGRLHTPDLRSCGVAGIMRERVIEWAERHGVEVRVGDFTPERLLASEGVFITNSVLGVLPVNRVEDVEFGIPEATVRIQRGVFREEEESA